MENMCDILRRSVKPLPRYGRSFFHFSRWRPSAILDFQAWNFNCILAVPSEGQYASPWHTSCRSVKPLQRWPFFHFWRWRQSAILDLDLLYACLDHPRRVFCGLCQCAKFGWNQCRNFNNMLIVRLEKCLYMSFLGCFWVLKMGEIKIFFAVLSPWKCNNLGLVSSGSNRVKISSAV